MAPAPHSTAAEAPRRRADAERSIASILDAAVEALAGNPDVSMAEIARRAGLTRATIYVHFPNRDALLAAVTHHAVADVTARIAATDPGRGEPAEALKRVVAAAWQGLGRFHALVAVNARLAPEELHRRHHAVLDLLQPLIERGQRDGSFRADVAPAWHLAMMLALIHAASGEVRAGRAAEGEAESALVATVSGALGARP